jgi:hypothetical protein
MFIVYKDICFYIFNHGQPSEPRIVNVWVQYVLWSLALLPSPSSGLHGVATTGVYIMSYYFDKIHV